MAWVEHQLRRRIRLAVAGAVVLTALTAATASASMPSAEGARAQETAGLAPGSAARPGHNGGGTGTRQDATSQFPGFVLDRGRYTTFDVPGATAGVTPTGINDFGQVVGKYNTGTSSSGAGASEHGFLRDRRGRVTRIDLPGARSTATSRINDRGQIAGVYSQNTGRVGDDPNRRGFMLDHGKLIRIDYPGAVYTQAFGLNNRGQVVGEYQDASGYHAFRWDKGRFTTIDAPGAVGAVATSALGINDHGDVVGIYFTDLTLKPGTEHGYLLRNGVFTPFDAPGAALTLAFDVNDGGQIVLSGLGSTPAGPVAHGFVLRDGVKGAFTLVDVPGSTSTSAAGINNLGQVTGGYTPAATGSSSSPTGMQLMSTGLGL
jgi:probable HAF family extracellular repeat protein